MANFLENAEVTLTLELARYGRRCDGEILGEVGTQPTMNIELATQERAQQGLLFGCEEMPFTLS